MTEHISARKSSSAPQAVSKPKTAAPLVRHATASGGQALDARTQQTMAARFGHDFSRVRVHTDSAASSSAQAVNAQAYTVGEDIVFQGGRFSPHSRDGERLLAHELTHVVQQAQAGPGTWERVSRPGDESEQEAETLAGQALNGREVQVRAAPTTAVQAYLAAEPDSLPSVGDIGSGIAGLGGMIGGGISDVGGMVGSGVAGAGSLLGGGVSALGGMFGSGSVGEGIGNIAGGAISGIGGVLGSGITKAAGGWGENVSGVASGVGSAVSGLGDLDPSQLLM